MKRIFILVAAALLFSNVQAQDDDADYDQVLPDDAQKCGLPASPDAIPEDATYDDLLNAKKQIAVFQGEIESFRSCLTAADKNPDNTPGNTAAIERQSRVGMDFHPGTLYRTAHETFPD